MKKDWCKNKNKLKQNLEPDFKNYASQVVRNAKVLGDTLKSRGL